MAVLSLALGIGANTAIYSLFYTVMLRQLPQTTRHQPSLRFEVAERLASGDRRRGDDCAMPALRHEWQRR